MSYQLFPSDLTRRGWNNIKDLLPEAKPGGRPRSTDLRMVINAVFYLEKTGCQWRYLPPGYPPWQTVYGYFRRWKQDGTWERLHDALRARVRRRMGRAEEPTAAVIDSQSVKTTEMARTDRGFDGGKKVKGRKRHIAVDTEGLLLGVKVTAANVQDRTGARLVLAMLATMLLRVTKVWADGGYRSGPLEKWLLGLRPGSPIALEVVKRSDDLKGFVVLPRRWVVERTFAWLGRHRRLSKDYERLPETSEAFIRIAMTRLMLARLEAY